MPKPMHRRDQAVKGGSGKRQEERTKNKIYHRAHGGRSTAVAEEGKRIPHSGDVCRWSANFKTKHVSPAAG
jgi:hypothetical protein